MKKRFVTAVLMLCLAFSLVACGGKESNEDSQKPSTEETQQEETESEEKGLVYTIKVVNDKNEPIGGMLVQFSGKKSVPAMTNAQGIAEFPVEELEEGYKASITSLPDGYIYDGETTVYYEEGKTEVVFVIKAKK